ncbi:MAG TPA: hypothetical protein QGH10_26240 [Armatimonadota bacterium]|nr:hypothetical protein [Armatimonadota bacterium]
MGEASHLRYYGYYFVESKAYGSHLDEVADYTNLQWVQGTDGLRKCADIGTECVLELRWQFFSSGTGEDEKPVSVLREDYKAQWRLLADAVAPDIDSIAAFYMLDEPYWRGASKPDLDTAIETVKADFPDTPVMVVFARPSLTDELLVPEGADWVGFDLYGPISDVAQYMRLLKSRLHAHQKLFLVPQTLINKAAPTDEALAALNEEYYDLASSEPLVIGLLNFGLWTGAQPGDIPETIRTQREIGMRIRSAEREDE